MFIVRKEQAEAYRVPMLEDFEARAAQYLRKCLAKTTARYTDQQLRQRVRECLPRARRYGLTSEAGVVCFAAATFLLEEDFDDRRRFLPAQIILRSPKLDPKAKGEALL